MSDEQARLSVSS